MTVITPQLCRAARALLNWRQDELAKAAGVAPNTVGNFEVGRNAPIPSTLVAMQAALEAAGIEFLAGNGVRLRK